MLLNIVNPNTTAAMTKTIAAAAARVARPDTVIRAVSSAFGPASIEGAYDDAFAVPGLLARIAEGEAEGADAHVIACFDDTGLDAARALATAWVSATAWTMAVSGPVRESCMASASRIGRIIWSFPSSRRVRGRV